MELVTPLVEARHAGSAEPLLVQEGADEKKAHVKWHVAKNQPPHHGSVGPHYVRDGPDEEDEQGPPR